MDRSSFDTLIDGWWKQKYTAKEMVGHLLYHLQETLGKLKKHTQEIERLKQRTTQLEDEVCELKGKSG